MGPDGQAGVRVNALLYTAETGHALRQPCLDNLHAKGSSMSTRPSDPQRHASSCSKSPGLSLCVCMSHVGTPLPE